MVTDQAKSTGICPTVSGGNLALRRCSCAKYRWRTLHPLQSLVGFMECWEGGTGGVNAGGRKRNSKRRKEDTGNKVC